jgi:hypothetical protein
VEHRQEGEAGGTSREEEKAEVEEEGAIEWKWKEGATEWKWT